MSPRNRLPPPIQLPLSLDEERACERSAVTITRYRPPYARWVLFEKRLQEGLRNGSIRLAFRRWRRAQVVSGRQYRSPIGVIDVQSISVVEGQISPEDARAAGYPSVDSLIKDMKGPVDGQL